MNKMPETTSQNPADAPILTALTPLQEQKLQNFVRSAPRLAHSHRIDRAACEEALFRSLNKGNEPVALIWCESPWEFAATKALVRLNSLRAKGHSELVDKVLTELSDAQWQKLRRIVETACDKRAPENQIEEDTFALRRSIFADIYPNIELLRNKLQSLVSIPVQLKLRQAFRQAAPRTENQQGFGLMQNRDDFLLQTQFGGITLGNLVDDRLPKEFTEQLTADTLAELSRVCNKEFLDLQIMARPTQTPKVNQLFSSLHESLSESRSALHTRPIAFVIQHLPPMLPDELTQPFRDWLLLKDQTFHISSDSADRICFICERPKMAHLNERGQLHNETGPAMTFHDGSEIYAINGVVVPSTAVLAAHEISVDQIEKQPNSEIRRILIQQYGMERYLKDCNAVKVSEDECGILYRKSQANDEPIMVVRVLNQTPEPDGTNKFYFLRVPPYITTARQAVAWTFNMQHEDYRPVKQT